MDDQSEIISYIQNQLELPQTFIEKYINYLFKD